LLRYRTEIVVPADRFLSLQLPPGFPEGPAAVTVHVHYEPADAESGAADDRPADDDPDREDIEWWDEFEEEPEPEA
jgi:hypothetical protein